MIWLFTFFLFHQGDRIRGLIYIEPPLPSVRHIAIPLPLTVIRIVVVIVVIVIVIGMTHFLEQIG